MVQRTTELLFSLLWLARLWQHGWMAGLRMVVWYWAWRMEVDQSSQTIAIGSLQKLYRLMKDYKD